MSQNQLKIEYYKHLEEFLDHQKEGNNDLARKSHDKMDMYFRQLRDSNMLADIVDLLEDPNDRVKSWVSMHLLIFDEGLAKKSLKSLTKIQTNIVGFNAEMTLKEWEQGNLIDYLLK